jgi:ATP-dependent Clp protease ATP-binding subunit ClpC
MGQVSLKFPVLVKSIDIDDKPHYHLRPLFISHPIVNHQRFKSAMSKLRSEIKHYFRGFILNQGNAEYLQWYMFNPSIEYKQFTLDLNLGKTFVSGNFGVVYFKVKNLPVVFLPNVKQFMFIPETDEQGHIHLEEQVRKVVLRLLKEEKAAFKDDFTIEHYLSDKKEFVTEFDTSLNISHSDFKFKQKDQNFFFALMFEGSDFDGRTELDKVGYDLNDFYPSELRRAFYIDQVVDKVYQVIYQKSHTPLAIVGPEGVGRHTLMHEVVYRYLSNHYGNSKRNQKVWHLDPTRVIAGMSIVGMWQKRFEAIIDYLKKPVPQADFSDTMMVDNPVALLRIGKSAQNNMTLGDVLKPYLEKRELQVVLISSPEEWKVIQEKDRRFADLFQVIRLSEPKLDLAARIILKQRRYLEIENDTTISIQAINQLFTIHRNYLNNSALPGSIMKMLQRLAVKYRHQDVDAPEVREEFKAFSGLEERIFDSTQSLSGEEIKNQISRQLVGQEEAAKSLADVVHIIKGKLADRSKPVSSFLFIGPTGVGKTQAAKVLSEFLSGDQSQLIRFDMNEFIDEYAVQRLIGDYYQPEGLLTGKVRYQPFGILLLDEIEKAHPKVYDILLQVLDDGRLTDSLGRTVDFTNTIIIMTSNLGAEKVASYLGYDRTTQDPSAIYRKAVENYFRPEFINRIDKIVIFKPLQLDHILSIAQMQIKELLSRDGFVRRTTILNISKSALEWVARRGFDGRMGGRALKRQIEKDLTALSAEQLIATANDQPVIMDIDLEGQHLIPSITSLDFVSPLVVEVIPHLPELKQGRGFYKRLLNELDRLDERIAQGEDARSNSNNNVIVIGEKDNTDDLNWQYYHFKTKLDETKENIKTVMLGFRDNYFREGPAIPLRLKRGYLQTKKDPGTKGWRENVKDRLFQEEALREISEGYYFAASQFDSFKTEFVDNYLTVQLLKLFGEGVLEGKSELLELRFRSCITHMGDWEIDFLMKNYIAFFKMLDLNIKFHYKEKWITVEGYSLFELLQGEAGIHLFYVAHQNPLPVELKIIRKEENGQPHFTKKVIRIYDGNKTLTDLRTGFSNDINITPNELKLLIYAGISEEIREGLLG